MNIFKIKYGTMPKLEQFNRAMLEVTSPNKPIRFRNDARLGSMDLTCRQFYMELVKAKNEGTEESMEWARRHLYFISIHWE